jgi:hypothetical protein
MIPPVDVVLILWNPDVIRLVSLTLLLRRMESCGMEPSDGPENIEQLIECCDPSVVVFDLSPPYYESTEVVAALSRRFSNSSFVLTCADPALALKAAPWLSDHHIFQKPYAVDQVADTVGSMVRRAPERMTAARRS